MKTFVADFETTVYDGQESTEVWASALADMNDENDTVFVFHSIDETLEYLEYLEVHGSHTVEAWLGEF